MKEKINWANSIIKSGYSLKDKLALIIYFMSWPLRITFLKNMKTIKDITVKNSDGIFFCGNNISSVGSVNPLIEINLRKYFNLEKGTFIDIGAAVGKYTIMMGKRLGNQGKVISIEPEKNNFEILKRNVRLNKLRNVLLINCACSSDESYRKFYLDAIGTGASSFYKEKVQSSKTITVQAKKLDKILSELKIKNVALIKIDVEGAEVDVLKGAIRTLKSHPRIIFEAWDKEHLKKIEEILKPFNYKIKQIAPENYIAH